MKKEIYNIEVTDSFQGEANYSWVKRFEVEAKNLSGAIRVVKKDLGISAYRHKKTEYSPWEVRLDFYGLNWVIFID